MRSSERTISCALLVFKEDYGGQQPARPGKCRGHRERISSSGMHTDKSQGANTVSSYVDPPLPMMRTAGVQSNLKETRDSAFRERLFFFFFFFFFFFRLLGLAKPFRGPSNWKGKEYLPPAGAHWKTTPGGMRRLAWANRLVARGRTVNYKRDALDFPVTPLTHLWTDIRLGYASDQKTYVVQTSSKVVERCILMTTDPGDLVLDPTCGSGTSAYVSEQWGRRWITIDTSRVALTLTRQRLIAARLPAVSSFWIRWVRIYGADSSTRQWHM